MSFSYPRVPKEHEYKQSISWKEIFLRQSLSPKGSAKVKSANSNIFKASPHCLMQTVDLCALLFTTQNFQSSSKHIMYLGWLSRSLQCNSMTIRTRIDCTCLVCKFITCTQEAGTILFFSSPLLYAANPECPCSMPCWKVYTASQQELGAQLANRSVLCWNEPSPGSLLHQSCSNRI